MPEQPVAVAQPPWGEWGLALLLYPIVAGIGMAFLTQGLDQLDPSFLSDRDFAANRLRMGIVFLVLLALLVGWTIRSNRRTRHFAVFEDRLTIGRPPNTTVPFAQIERLRVGAPMPGSLQALANVNAALGTISKKNRHAANHLENTYLSTIVIDTATSSVVFQLGTVDGGQELLDALLERNEEALTDPIYTVAEAKRFGRFKPGTYPRA